MQNHMVCKYSNFIKYCHITFLSYCINLYLKSFCFSISLTILGVIKYLTVSHSDEHYLVSYCVDLHFWCEEDENIFICLLALRVFWKLPIHIFSCFFFFNVLFCHFLLICSITNIFVYFGYRSVVVMRVANFFSH